MGSISNVSNGQMAKQIQAKQEANKQDQQNQAISVEAKTLDQQKPVNTAVEKASNNATDKEKQKDSVELSSKAAAAEETNTSKKPTLESTINRVDQIEKDTEELYGQVAKSDKLSRSEKKQILSYLKDTNQKANNVVKYLEYNQKRGGVKDSTLEYYNTRSEYHEGKMSQIREKIGIEDKATEGDFTNEGTLKRAQSLGKEATELADLIKNDEGLSNKEKAQALKELKSAQGYLNDVEDKLSSDDVDENEKSGRRRRSRYGYSRGNRYGHYRSNRYQGRVDRGGNNQTIDQSTLKTYNKRMDDLEGKFDKIRDRLGKGGGDTKPPVDDNDNADKVKDKLKGPKIRGRGPGRGRGKGQAFGPRADRVGTYRSRMARSVTDVTSILTRGNQEAPTVREHTTTPNITQLMGNMLNKGNSIGGTINFGGQFNNIGTSISNAIDSAQAKSEKAALKEQDSGRIKGGQYTEEVHARESDARAQAYAALDQAVVRVNEKSAADLAEIEEQRAAALANAETESAGSGSTAPDYSGITNQGQAIQALNNSRDTAYAAIDSAVTEGLITAEQGQAAHDDITNLYNATKAVTQGLNGNGNSGMLGGLLGASGNNLSYEQVIEGFDSFAGYSVSQTTGQANGLWGGSAATADVINADYDAQAEQVMDRTSRQLSQLEKMKDNMARVQQKVEGRSGTIRETTPKNKEEAEVALNNVEQLFATDPQAAAFVKMLFGQE